MVVNISGSWAANAVITHLFIKIRKFNESNTEMYSLGLEALKKRTVNLEIFIVKNIFVVDDGYKN